MTAAAVRKAVVPAAGLGTRCLPLTKAVPKELLPIYDRPAIEIIADEAVQSGITTLVLVTARGKSELEDHFDRHPYLEHRLAGKDALIELTLRPGRGLDVVAVRQGVPRGLGHAVGSADVVVGDEPFAVILPDDLIAGPRPALAPLIETFERTGKGVVLLMEVPDEDVSRYGIVAGERQPDGTIAITDLVEKPAQGEAPTNLAIVGRYVFPASLMERIRHTTPGALGEIQLTDAMQSLARDEGLLGVMLEGRRLDTGTPLGVLRASLYFAAQDPEARENLRRLADELL